MAESEISREWAIVGSDRSGLLCFNGKRLFALHAAARSFTGPGKILSISEVQRLEEPIINLLQAHRVLLPSSECRANFAQTERNIVFISGFGCEVTIRGGSGFEDATARILNRIGDSESTQSTSGYNNQNRKLIFHPSAYYWPGRIFQTINEGAVPGVLHVPIRWEEQRLVVGPLVGHRSGDWFAQYRKRLLSRRATSCETIDLFSALYDVGHDHIRQVELEDHVTQLQVGLEKLVDTLKTWPGDPEGVVISVDFGTLVAEIDYLCPENTFQTATTAEIIRRAVLDGPHIGLIRQHAITHQHGPVTVYGAMSASVPPLCSDFESALDSWCSIGGGVSTQEQVAREKMYSEIVERVTVNLQCGTISSKISRYEDVESVAPSPNDWILFSDADYSSESFPFQRFTEMTPVRWVPGKCLGDMTEAQLPLQLLIGEKANEGSEMPIGYGSSSGVAAHVTFEAACLSGLYELIERDSIMCAWLVRAKPTKVLPKFPQRGSPAAHYYEALAEAGYKVESYLLPNDIGVAVVMTLGFRESDRKPNFVFGAGARLRLEDAYTRSLEEACQFLGWTSDAIPEDFDPGDSFENVIDFSERYYLYNIIRYWPEFEFLRNTDSSISIDAFSGRKKDDTADLVETVRRLSNRGLRSYAVDLSATLSLSAGRYVVSTAVPGLQPVNTDHNLMFSDLRRLSKYCSRLDIPWPRDLNSSPHPLP